MVEIDPWRQAWLPQTIRKSNDIDLFSEQLIKRERRLGRESGNKLLLWPLVSKHGLFARGAPQRVDIDPLPH